MTYYQKHKEERLTYQKEYGKKYRETHPQEDYIKHLEKRREKSRLKNQEKRKTLLWLLGGKCVRCGETDFRCLQLDHVNGGGHQEFLKLRNRVNYVNYQFDQIQSGSIKYQILCANCNWKKKYENKEHYKGKY